MSLSLPPSGSTPLPGAREGRDPSRAIKRGPRQVPAEVVAATQRDRLYDGLVHTVASKGYVNARVSDICQAAGVTRPAFYALFPGKEAAFLAAYRHGTGVLLRLMRAAYAESDDWSDGVQAALRVLLDVLASVPAFARMAVVEVDVAGPDVRHQRDQLLAGFREFFRDAGPRPPSLTEEMLVDAIVGGIYATVRQRVAAGAATALPGLLPGLTYFAIVPFVGPEQAARVAAAVPSNSPVTTPPCVGPPGEAV